MDRETVIKELRFMARQKEDTAIACDVVRGYFTPEFDRGVASSPEANAQTRKRSLEIYHKVDTNRIEAHRLREEIKVFEAAISMLETGMEGRE